MTSHAVRQQSAPGADQAAGAAVPPVDVTTTPANGNGNANVRGDGQEEKGAEAKEGTSTASSRVGDAPDVSKGDAVKDSEGFAVSAPAVAGGGSSSPEVCDPLEELEGACCLRARLFFIFLFYLYF